MQPRKRTVWILLCLFMLTLVAVSPVQAEQVEVEAESYVLMDADSGKVLLAKNEHKRLPPASMTKLMTMILAAQDLEEGKVSVKDKVITSEEAWKMGGSQIYLEPGEEMTFEDMMIAIAVGSANDASVAVAEHLEGTHKNFVDRMNKQAKMLGLKNTHFVNSYGLPAENHYTSAYDMAVMARYALQYTKILEYCSIKEYNLRQGEFKLFNTNKLLWWYEGTDGFKTGWTNEAKYCLTATAKRDGLRLIGAVMASPKQHGNHRDMMKLFNYGFAKYAYKSFFSRGSVCGVVQVGKGIGDSVEVIAEDDVGAIVEKGQERKGNTEKRRHNCVRAPVETGEQLGGRREGAEGNLVKEVNLFAASDVPKGGFLKEILKMLAETYLL